MLRFGVGVNSITLFHYLEDNRLPQLFREAGLFKQYGAAFCGRCSWHQSFPRRRSV